MKYCSMEGPQVKLGAENRAEGRSLKNAVSLASPARPLPVDGVHPKSDTPGYSRSRAPFGVSWVRYTHQTEQGGQGFERIWLIRRKRAPLRWDPHLVLPLGHCDWPFEMHSEPAISSLPHPAPVISVPEYTEGL